MTGLASTSKKLKVAELPTELAMRIELAQAEFNYTLSNGCGRPLIVWPLGRVTYEQALLWRALGRPTAHAQFI